MSMLENVQAALAVNVGVKPEGEEITLASGAKSRWYCDCRPVMAGPHALDLVHQVANVARAKIDMAEYFGGPIFGGALMARMLNPRGYCAFYRPPKEHGKPDSLIGAVQGQPWILVDDVWTTGGTVAKMAEAIWNAGGAVMGVVVILNRVRMEGRYLRPGEEFQVWGAQDDPIPVYSLFVPQDFGIPDATV